MAEKVSLEDGSSDSVILSWKYPDGSVASARPLPREQAERLARVYGSMYPDQTYWMETVTLDDTSAFVRIQRRHVRTSPQKTK